jgi:prolyl-tRNA synthetase
VRENDENIICEKIVRSCEVGNIFKLGNKWTKESTMNLFVTGQDNKPIHPLMGCYGIGTTRCMGVIAEIYSDELGLKWPESVAPFQFHIVSAACKNSELNDKILKISEEIYSGEYRIIKKDNQIKIIKPGNLIELSEFMLQDFQSMSGEFLWDDRENISIGAKLKDADLIGCPWQIIITEKSLEKGGIEVKNRETCESFVVQI